MLRGPQAFLVGARSLCFMTRANHLLIKLERQGTTNNQRLVILAPVVDVILCFLQLPAYSHNLFAAY
jgi:hypothetical protein